MNAQQTQTNGNLKKQARRFWITCLSFPLMIPIVSVLIYYGYCFGLWGRNSLLLQHLFQCKCPASSEEARYPKQADVIVSACRNGGVRLSPGGRFLFVRESDSDVLSTYLLDLRTNEKIPFTLSEGAYYFLTDDLVYGFVYYIGDEIIFDRTTNTVYPIQKFVYARPGSYINGNADPAKLAHALREADELYFIESQDLIVAIFSDFRNQPERNFLSGRFDISGFDPDRTRKFLQGNNIEFQMVIEDFPQEAISPNGKFIARGEGIFDIETGKTIVGGIPRLLVRGWTYDGHGVIYSSHYKPCLLYLALPMGDGPWCEIDVPQPVILLKVPEEYLSPTPTP